MMLKFFADENLSSQTNIQKVEQQHSGARATFVKSESLCWRRCAKLID
jgi:hypothetical protein